MVGPGQNLDGWPFQTGLGPKARSILGWLTRALPLAHFSIVQNQTGWWTVSPMFLSAHKINMTLVEKNQGIVSLCPWLYPASLNSPQPCNLWQWWNEAPSATQEVVRYQEKEIDITKIVIKKMKWMSATWQTHLPWRNKLHANAPVTLIHFQIVLFSFRCIFKSIHFGLHIQMFAFSISWSYILILLIVSVWTRDETAMKIFVEFSNENISV